MRVAYLPEKYITYELAAKTSYKSIKNAYDRNNISIIVRGSFWYFEGLGVSDKIFNLVKKEMRKHFPHLKYCFEEV